MHNVTAPGGARTPVTSSWITPLSCPIRLATTGMRGQAPRASVERLIEVIGRLAALGELMPDEILDCEVNPMAVTQAGLVALDVLVTLGDGERPVRHPRPLHKLRQLLAPRSVAIAGVSTRMNPGRIILRNLLRDGFDPRRIWIVKPGADAAGTDRIDGCDCVPDLASLPEKADLFVVAVSAAQAPEIVAEVIESQGCHARHTVGQKFVMDGNGQLITRECPEKMCLFALAALESPVNQIYERFIAHSDPTNERTAVVQCSDVGLDKGGWGKILMKISVERVK